MSRAVERACWLVLRQQRVRLPAREHGHAQVRKTTTVWRSDFHVGQRFYCTSGRRIFLAPLLLMPTDLPLAASTVLTWHQSDEPPSEVSTATILPQKPTPSLAPARQRPFRAYRRGCSTDAGRDHRLRAAGGDTLGFGDRSPDADIYTGARGVRREVYSATTELLGEYMGNSVASGLALRYADAEIQAGARVSGSWFSCDRNRKIHRPDTGLTVSVVTRTSRFTNRVAERNAASECASTHPPPFAAGNQFLLLLTDSRTNCGEIRI